VWREGEYTDRGKWMDGWETRRRRTPGHDWAVIRLGLPGIVHGVVIDTAFFTGNFPEEASIDVCVVDGFDEVERTSGGSVRWETLLPKSPLKGNSKNEFAIDGKGKRVTHLRLNIFPDGGVARLRVHGEVVPDASALTGETDLAAMAVGQAASVSIGAVGAVVPGAVTAIAPTTTGSTTGGVVSYAVTVSLERPPANVRVGMTANVTITIDSVTNVLTVPAAALRGTAGAYTVLVVGADGTPTAQPVQVGLVTNTTAEIKGGLQAGQQVVTGVNTALTGTTTTTGGGAGFGGFGGGAIPGTGTRRGVGN